MMAAAIVCAAAFANAASVAWTGNVGAYGSDDDCGGYIAYVFLSQDTSNTKSTISIAEAQGYAAAGNWSALAAAAAMDAVSCDGWGENFETAALEGFPGNGESVSGFAIVLNSDDTATADHFSVMYGDASEKTASTYTLGNPSAGPTFVLEQGAWLEVGAAPEPTSGLLLLIGVAGLALRRRRA